MKGPVNFVKVQLSERGYFCRKSINVKRTQNK